MAIQQLIETVGVGGYTEEKMRNALASLTPREEQIIRYRFGVDERQRTLREVGDICGVSSERIRQIEVKAIQKLRQGSCWVSRGVRGFP